MPLSEQSIVSTLHGNSGRLACGALCLLISSTYSDHMCVEWWWCSVVILIASIALFQFVGGAGRSAYSVGGGKHVSDGTHAHMLGS